MIEIGKITFNKEQIKKFKKKNYPPFLLMYCEEKEE